MIIIFSHSTYEEMHWLREFTLKRDVRLANQNMKYVVVSDTSDCCEILLQVILFFVSFIFMQMKSSLLPFLKIHIFVYAKIYNENLPIIYYI